MVRESKLPEITLHLDNKKATLSEIALAAKGSINIYPTSQGGVFPVQNLITGLDLIDYVYYENEILKIGNVKIGLEDGYGTDLSGGVVNELHINSSESIIIGDVSGVEIEVYGTKINIDGGETSIKGESVKIDASGAMIFTGKDIQIGSLTSDSLTLSGKDIEIDASGTIEITASKIDLTGPVYYKNDWTLEGNATFLDEFRAPEGIRFDMSGEGAIYVSDDYLNVRVGIEGIVFRTTTDELLNLSASGDLIVKHDFTCNGNVDISGNLNVLGNIESEHVRIDTSGNITCKNSLFARDEIRCGSQFKVDSSGLMLVERIVCENIDASGILNFSGVLEADTIQLIHGDNRVSIESSGNLTCTGTLTTKEIYGESIQVSTNLNTTTIEPDLITTDKITCHDAIILNNIECSGNIFVYADADIRGGCETKKLTVTDSIKCPGDGSGTQMNSNGDISTRGLATFDVLETQTIRFVNNEFINFDSSGGRIYGTDLTLRDFIYTQRFLTDGVLIDSSGIECSGTIRCETFLIEDSSGNERVKFDVSGNITVQGTFMMNGDITTTGNLNSINTIDVSGIRAEVFESQTIRIGMNTHPIENTPYSSLILTSGNSQDPLQQNVVYIREEDVCILKYDDNFIEMNELKPNSIKVSKYTNQNVNQNSQKPVIGTEITSVNIDGSGITIQDSTKKTEIKSTEIITDTIHVSKVETNDIIMSDTIHNADDTKKKRNSIEINVDFSGETTRFGPEYTVVLNISHTTLGNTTHQINLGFVVNFGIYFTPTHGKNSEGNIRDINGADRLLFKHYDEDVWRNKVNEIEYERIGNTIRVILNDIGRDKDTTYNYYISKGCGLSLFP